jgi:uncharacterized protein (TIGR02996 family)
MTPEEAAFQTALDLNPDDHITRLVFADYLDEQGDERADGMRALGLLRIRPGEWYSGNATSRKKRYVWHDGHAQSETDLIEDGILPLDWVLVMVPYQMGYTAPMVLDYNIDSKVPFDTPMPRRRYEDHAARAFSKLAPSRQAELLSQPALS